MDESCSEVSYTMINPLPENHYDWIKWHGICSGYGTWENNAENFIKEKGMSLSDVIAHPEDIYERLKLYGIDEITAWKRR